VDGEMVERKIEGLDGGRILRNYKPGKGGIIVFDDGDIEEDMATEKASYLALSEMPELDDGDDDDDHGSESGSEDEDTPAPPKPGQKRKSWSDRDEEDTSDEEDRPRQRRKSNSVCQCPQLYLDISDCDI